MDDLDPPHLRRRQLTDERLAHERSKRLEEEVSASGRFAQVRDPSAGVSVDPLKWTRRGRRVLHPTPDYSGYWYDYD